MKPKKAPIALLILLIFIPLWSQVSDKTTGSSFKSTGNWELSVTFDISGVNKTAYPHFTTIFSAGWEPALPDSLGRINITRRRGTADTSAYGVLGRTFFVSEKDLVIKIRFEYNEEISVFVNGKFIRNTGRNGKNRAGLLDLEINARKGLNELFVFVISSSSAWNFRIGTNPELKPYEVSHNLAGLAWETEEILLTPESVLFNPENKVYYVSSYDYMYYTKGAPSGYISKINAEGKIIDKEWITGLFAPTGICLYKNKLYVTVRNGVVVFDTKKGTYITQYDIENTDFLNDIAVDSKGRIYISDTSRDPDKTDIYILENGQVEPWLSSASVSRSNGIYVYQDKLLIGNNGEGLFQAVDLRDKTITTICSLGAGIIDGIRVDNNGNYLVSHWEGKIFRITPVGDITEIYDTRLDGYNAADYEFNKKQNMLLIPTFYGNKVAAVRLEY